MALDPLGAMLLTPPSAQGSGGMTATEHQHTTSSRSTDALSSSASAFPPCEDGQARADTRHMQTPAPLRPDSRVSNSDLEMLIPPPPPRPPHAASARADPAGVRAAPSRKAAKDDHLDNDDDDDDDELPNVRASVAHDSDSEFGDVHLHVHCALPNLDALADSHQNDVLGSKRSARKPVGEVVDHGAAPPAPKRVKNQNQRGRDPQGPPLIIGQGRGLPCAICKQATATPYHALTAHNITSSSLDALVHRGWRRLGHHIYRPLALLACCPRYFARTDVARFKPTVDDVACLTEINTFLALGEPSSPLRGAVAAAAATTVAAAASPLSPKAGEFSAPASASPATPRHRGSATARTVASPIKLPGCSSGSGTSSSDQRSDTASSPNSQSSNGVGGSAQTRKVAADLSDLCHNQVYRLASRGRAPRHELELLLVPAKATPEGLRLYALYQARFHSVPAVSEMRARFSREMCSSPIKYEAPQGQANVPFCGYGSFHAELRLNGQLVALQALDVLPTGLCPSSLVYDPRLSSLPIKHYVRLRLIELALQIHGQCDRLRYIFHATPLSPYHLDAFRALENDALQVQDTSSSQWYPLQQVRAQMLNPGTRRLLLEGQKSMCITDEAIDEEAVKIAERNEVVRLASWAGRQHGSPSGQEFAQCARVLGTDVVGSGLTLVLNAMAVE